MSHSFTPGPWQWLGVNLEGPQFTDVIEAKVSCGMWCQGGNVDLTISDADRRLIAAAPALYEALAALVERGTDSPEHMAAERALALARGEA